MSLFPQYSEFSDRYFRNHWTLKAEMACAFLAVAILLRKLVSLSRDRQALSSVSLGDPNAGDQAVSLVERAGQLSEAVVNSHPKLLGTRWVRRILDVCDHLLQRRSAEGLEDH
ncbi:MAG: hypothetical protein ACK5EA_25770, partial [Planctomycetaceae bacterium]